MRHIKTYKIFESKDIDIESMKQEIADIFQEAVDIGYRIQIFFEEHNRFDEKKSYRFSFRIEHINDSIDFFVNEIREDVLRIIDYIKSISPISNIYLFTMPTRWNNWNDFKSDVEDKEIYVFRVEGWMHNK